LSSQGFNAIPFDCKGDFIKNLIKIKPDVCFNALHGLGGEDGSVQSLLEKNNIPYTHSGISSSKICMNKVLSKELFLKNNINTPKYELIKINNISNQNKTLPFVIKPVQEGSSNGVYVILNESDRNKLLKIKKSWIYGENVLIEDYIGGIELSCAVFNNKPTEVVEIKTKNTFYDFDAKYEPGASDHIIPANIPTEIYNLVKKTALKCHNIFGCRGVSRTDFRWSGKNNIESLFALEINTQPGMTITSLVPELLDKQGISYGDLILYLLEDASCDR
ncbi:MAG: D-alanine--D-alanine ligase, partial [Rhodobiaceae bacterium]|nr:D-alanine--D-alanine ligase [Rhodobiaceae bacterium]